MSYITVKIHLSPLQQSKLKRAKNTGTPVILLLSKSDIDKEPAYNTKLTKLQLCKLEKNGTGHIIFSKTQLMSQGAGLWDVLMKAGRWIGCVGSKLAKTGIGSAIKTVAKTVIPTVAVEATGAFTNYSVSIALADKDKAEVEAQASAPVEGSGLLRAGYWLKRAGGRGLRRAGHTNFNDGGTKVVLPIAFTKAEMIPILKFINQRRNNSKQHLSYGH